VRIRQRETRERESVKVRKNTEKDGEKVVGGANGAKIRVNLWLGPSQLHLSLLSPIDTMHI
jgi:hypothetical protein